MNTGSAIVFAAVGVLLALAVRKMVRDRRAGRTSCGCGCSTCSGTCHKT